MVVKILLCFVLIYPYFEWRIICIRPGNQLWQASSCKVSGPTLISALHGFVAGYRWPVAVTEDAILADTLRFSSQSKRDGAPGCFPSCFPRSSHHPSLSPGAHLLFLTRSAARVSALLLQVMRCPGGPVGLPPA